ncbi:MAG TPA: hypothetical protein PLI16_06990 [Bacteroidales bacterium]|nr:hypothetical protein [Bacteroidales bacterium]HNZ43880.1 hypothetical protein [Bacteroidales bacterium]HOH84342.1 hypothetical protein [Bacteroidales bacterium]HPB26582.1 hypothetical protein [Bacteroidales bacterium]HQN17207.1 hypothetical protein [Bacteroidales bacterium]
MIKKLSGLIFTVFLIGTLHAQQVYKADPRLTECFDQAYLSELENSQSELLLYYNYYLDNSYYKVDLNTLDKKISAQDIHTVLLQNNNPQVKEYFKETTFTKEKFNPLKYQFNLSSNSFTTYLWEKEGIAIVFYPLSHISANFKEYLKTINK